MSDKKCKGEHLIDEYRTETTVIFSSNDPEYEERWRTFQEGYAHYLRKKWEKIRKVRSTSRVIQRHQVMLD